MSILRYFAMGGAVAKTYIEDVFSAYTYTGNGSTQTITNGIDLATNGGLVWTKNRTTTAIGHALHDTVRGSLKTLASNTTGAQVVNADGLNSFTSSGFTLNSGGFDLNHQTATYISWTFRKATKFFDVVQLTNDGSNGSLLTFSHSLGIEPGMIIVKSLSTGSWWVWNRGMTSKNYYLRLELTNAEANGSVQCWEATSSTFSVLPNLIGINTETYVAYLFAHDTGADGLIQCGSYTGDGTTNSSKVINLGWEAQYVLIKRTDFTGDWWLVDTMRGFVNSGSDGFGGDRNLWPNSSSAETAQVIGGPAASGFYVVNDNVNQNGSTYVYMAIRRGPMKQPTSGDQVYNAIAVAQADIPQTTTQTFPPDLLIHFSRNGSAAENYRGTFVDRLRGMGNVSDTGTQVPHLRSTATAQETATGYGSLKANSRDITLGPGWNSALYGDFIFHFFRRYPGVFDIVCYTVPGTVAAGLTINHNLGASPELIIFKRRDSSTFGDWWVTYGMTSTHQYYVKLNTTDAGTGGLYSANNGLDALPTSTQFVLDSSIVGQPAPSATMVAYLFATKAGLSKVGSYTGDGTSGQTIDAGLSTGARFVLIKRTDSTGDWYVFDSTRGIVADNDPHLSLNTTAAEVTTDDSVDPAASGFIVNQNATTNLNVSSATYIYLAIS